MNNYFKKPTNFAQEPRVEGQTIEFNVPKLVRSDDSGDKIYLTKNGYKHWITSPEVLKELGFDFGQDVSIDRETMMNLVIGEPIKMANVQNFKDLTPPVIEESITIEAKPDPNVVEHKVLDGKVTVITTKIDRELFKHLRSKGIDEIVVILNENLEGRAFTSDDGDKILSSDSLEQGIATAKSISIGKTILYHEI